MEEALEETSRRMGTTDGEKEEGEDGTNDDEDYGNGEGGGGGKESSVETIRKRIMDDEELKGEIEQIFEKANEELMESVENMKKEQVSFEWVWITVCVCVCVCVCARACVWEGEGEEKQKERKG